VLAVKLALSKTKLPKLLIKSDDEGQIEIDFSENSSDLVILKTENVPYAITVNKIGQYYVIDADLKEETVTKVKITLGFDSKGNIRFGNKDGFGSLDPDTLYTIIDVNYFNYRLKV
jgi:exosome complex RNA-binding protein Rrp42 (RNase PH superfamily)